VAKPAKARRATKPAKTSARVAKKPTKLGKAKAAKARPAKAAKAGARVAKKAAKAKAPASKTALKAKAPKLSPVRRRDASGHLDPKYAAELRAQSGPRHEGEDRAFLGKRGKRNKDPLAEELGEEFVETVTSGEDEGTELRDRKVVEELGGPFTVTSSNTEFGRGIDRSNPKGSTREPFPKS
jgi:hypothetical protein